jgi:hypothetical protein
VRVCVCVCVCACVRAWVYLDVLGCRHHHEADFICVAEGLEAPPNMYVCVCVCVCVFVCLCVCVSIIIRA